MDPAVVAALIAAVVALLVAAVSAYFTIWTTHRQRMVDLIVAALQHMTGGSQERGAGVAALVALRGPIDRRSSWFQRAGWRVYCPAVGQQLFRQLTYVLNYGRNRYQAHEVENVIAILNWLTEDECLFRSCDSGQRARLLASLNAYEAAAPVAANQPGEDGSIKAMRDRIPDWRHRLSS